MRAPRPRRLAIVAALAVATVGGLLMLAATPAPAGAPQQSGPGANPEPDYFAFVPSMTGTLPDGAVRANGADALVINAELGYLFDYYLAGLGERPLPAIRAEIIRELQRRLPARAADEAGRLLDHYLAYKRALAALEHRLPPASPAPGGAAAHMLRGARERLAAMRELRSNYFSDEEIAGLFSAGDAYDQDAIARLEIAGDSSLTATQRQQQLAALDAALSPAVRADREAPAALLRLEESVSAARAQGADDNEIYRLRSAALSPAAAARFAELDREEGEWQRRIAAYQAQRRQLQQQSASDAALQQLRDSGFSAAEQKRLPAYE